MHRVLELCLLALMLTGLYFVWQSGQQRSVLRTEYDRLVRLTGDLPLRDPGKVHILALETGESLHLAWRVYLPANYRLQVRYAGGSSSSSHSDPQHLIARVRFREGPAGRLQIYERFAGGSGQMGFGDESVAEFLHEKWDQVVVDHLGAGGKTAVLKPDDEAVLLRLTLPEELHEQAMRDMDARSLQTELPLLFEIRIGPPSARP